ncbi:hypothetical protein STEG23_009054, partial [Scotinomys teguina]
MARKAGQGKEEEESRTRQQEGKTPVREEEKTPACDGRGHHVVEPGPIETKRKGSRKDFFGVMDSKSINKRQRGPLTNEIFSGAVGGPEDSNIL